MKRIIVYAIMALCLISSSCDAQTRRSDRKKEKEEPPQQIDTITPMKTRLRQVEVLL